MTGVHSNPGSVALHEGEIQASDRIAVMSGTGVIDKRMLAAFIMSAIPPGMVMDTVDERINLHRGTCTKEPKEPETEIEKWNARVQAEKEAKRASKGKWTKK